MLEVLKSNEKVNGATDWQIQDTLENFEHCFSYDFFYGENLKRLARSVLQPACIDVTTVNDDHTTSVVQVVPPCRSLCLEMKRAFNPLEIYTSQCAGYLKTAIIIRDPAILILHAFHLFSTGIARVLFLLL